MTSLNSECYTNVYKNMDKVDHPSKFASIDTQLDYVLDNLVDFEMWYEAHFCAHFEAMLAQSTKSMYKAVKAKKTFELYQDMIQVPSVDKKFEALNNAILYAEPSEIDFLVDCFFQRSELHYQAGDFDRAMQDIEHAQHLRPCSYDCVERNVNILLKLNRSAQAYSFVEETLAKIVSTKATPDTSDTKNVTMLLTDFLKDLKQYKHEARNLIKDDEGGEEDNYFIMINGHADLVENLGKRIIYKAKQSIKAGVEVLAEQPTVMSLRSGSVHSYCNQCLKKCTNTFWPCAQCIDIVFCSVACSRRGWSRHRHECGTLGYIHKTMASQAPQVYRNFISLGHEEMLKLVEQEPSTLISDMDKSKSLSKEAVHKLFMANEVRMLHRIWKLKTVHTSTELTNALLLLGVYVHQHKHLFDNLHKETIVPLVKVLAASITKCVISEYGWHMVDEGGECNQVGNYQCLLGSLIGHSCEANCEWSFDGTHFHIKTKREIEPGEELTISYGISKETDFFKRQKHLANFLVTCFCRRCQLDSKQHFALRCDKCGGPVPYNAAELSNAFCLVCESKFESMALIKEVSHRFTATKQLMTLVSRLENVDLVKRLESLTSNLARYMHLHNKPFLDLVKALCEEYIKRGDELYSYAVEWFHWFAAGANVHLSDAREPMIRFHKLSLWAKAFHQHSAQLLKEQPLPEEVEVAEKLKLNLKEHKNVVNKMLTLADELKEMKKVAVFDENWTLGLWKSLKQQADELNAQYKQLATEVNLTA